MCESGVRAHEAATEVRNLSTRFISESSPEISVLQLIHTFFRFRAIRPSEECTAVPYVPLQMSVISSELHITSVSRCNTDLAARVRFRVLGLFKVMIARLPKFRVAQQSGHTWGATSILGALAAAEKHDWKGIAPISSQKCFGFMPSSLVLLVRWRHARAVGCARDH